MALSSIWCFFAWLYAKPHSLLHRMESGFAKFVLGIAMICGAFILSFLVSFLLDYFVLIPFSVTYMAGLIIIGPFCFSVVYILLREVF